MSMIPDYHESLISLHDAADNFEDMPDKLKEEKLLRMAADLLYQMQLESKGLKKVCEVYVNRKGQFVIQYDNDSIPTNEINETMLRLSMAITKQAFQKMIKRRV